MGDVFSHSLSLLRTPILCPRTVEEGKTGGSRPMCNIYLRSFALLIQVSKKVHVVAVGWGPSKH